MRTLSQLFLSIALSLLAGGFLVASTLEAAPSAAPGDPPNILIGSYTGLTFGAFVVNLSLVCLLLLVISCFYYLWWHKQDYLKA